MKKSLIVFSALISGTMAFGMSPAMSDTMMEAQMQAARPHVMKAPEGMRKGTYKVEIDNDTKYPIYITLNFSDGSKKNFVLNRHREKKLRRIPRTVHLTSVFAARVTKEGRRYIASFGVRMNMRGRNIDIEVKMDRRTGRIYLKRD